jgi:hypothetical protein
LRDSLVGDAGGWGHDRLVELGGAILSSSVGRAVG